VSERRNNLGIVFLALGSIIMLFEIAGILTGTLGGPPFLYFLGGAFEGIGVVFFISGILIRDNYQENRKMM